MAYWNCSFAGRYRGEQEITGPRENVGASCLENLRQVKAHTQTQRKYIPEKVREVVEFLARLIGEVLPRLEASS